MYEKGSKNHRYRSNSSRRYFRHYRRYPQDQGEQGGYALNKTPCTEFPYTAVLHRKIRIYGYKINL